MTDQNRYGYDDASSGGERAAKRDASIAGTYSQSELWDAVEKQHAKDPDKLSATQKVGLGYYVAAREAAQRVRGEA